MKTPRVLVNDKVKTSRLKNFKGKVTPFGLPKGCKARYVLVHYVQNTSTKVCWTEGTDELLTCILVILALICVLCFRLCCKLVFI